MKCLSLFSGKNKKNISKYHLLNFFQSMLSVNGTIGYGRILQESFMGVPC